MSAVAVDWTDDYMRWKVSKSSSPWHHVSSPVQVETLALQKSHKEGGQRTGLWSGRYEPSYGARQEELSGILRDHWTDTLEMTSFFYFW